MKKVFIFCEGKKEINFQSLDIKILEKILTDIEGATIIPIGGKRSLGAFIDGYIERGGVIKPELSIGLRDRDFDFPIPSNESLIESRENKSGSAKVIYATYRTCIENYLIDDKLIQAFLDAENLHIAGSIHEILEQSAKQIRYYTAARHALGKVQVPVKIKTTWTSGSGSLPNDFDKKYMLKESKTLIEKYRSPIEKVSFRKFRYAFKEFSELFENDEHYNNKQYLIYANGKDLAKSFSIQFENVTGKQFPNWQKYYIFAISKIDFLQFADFARLQSIIKNS